MLIAYASKYGSTRQIAECIASRLEHHGLSVDVAHARELRTIGDHGAVVIGSAVYFGSWMKEAAKFVRGNERTLAQRPVWLFSSGPLGTEVTDDHGRDVLVISRPKEFDAFEAAIRPREHRVFFGALHRGELRGGHRVLRLLPRSRKLLIEGDFREWHEIEAWADGIARELLPVAQPSPPRSTSAATQYQTPCGRPAASPQKGPGVNLIVDRRRTPANVSSSAGRQIPLS